MNETILITGGTGKIGGQLVNHFLREGWHVVYTTRRADDHRRLTERFDWQSPTEESLTAIEADFTDAAAVPKLLEAVREYSVNVLVNNARSLDSLRVQENGLSSRLDMLGEYLIDVVVPYELATGLLQAGTSLRHIINVGSIYGVVPFNPALYDNYPQSAPIQYGLAKAAMHQLTRELAIRYADRCQVNTVSYGGVGGRTNEAFRARYAALTPMGGMLSEEQTVGPIAFLASPASRGMTGQNIIQDGGWTVW